MYLLHALFSAQAFCTFLLGLTAVIGDWLVSVSNLDVYKAVFDNSTHSSIGALTWLIVSMKIRHKTIIVRFSEICLCALIASVIDLDHFFMARSIHLKDATNLQGRPPLHCSTIPIVVTGCLLLLANYLVSENLYHFGWIFFAAFASHHVRDATRRGFWFYQIGSTPPIPYFLYVTLTMTIPHFISYFMKMFYISSRNYETLHFENV